jgi:hypothetical protein
MIELTRSTQKDAMGETYVSNNTDLWQELINQFSEVTSTLKDIDVGESLDDETPSILYHYTTANGLKGIVESNTIWATHYRFLNDKTEYKYGQQIIENVLNETIGNHSDDKSLVDFVGKIIAGIKAPRRGIYIMSFSEKKDQLSQWKGYSDNGLGYSVGFDLAELSHLRPIQVVYDEIDREKHLDHRISILEKIADDKLIMGDNSVWGMVLSHIIQTLIYRWKDEGFKEEKEWRIVKSDIYQEASISIPDRLSSSEEFQHLRKLLQERITYRVEDLKFRESNGVLIPYIEIPFKTPKYPPIKEIIIGPSHDPEKTERATEAIALLLTKVGYTEQDMPQIEPSKIPYA